MCDVKVEESGKFPPFEESYCFECENKFRFDELVEKIDMQDGSPRLECPHCGFQVGGSW